MSTSQDIEKSDCKIIQYWRNCYYTHRTELAKRIFSKEPNINHQLLKDAPVIPHLKFNGCTALHFAARIDKKVDVEWLISQGADPMIKNHNGFTPVHWAVTRNYEILSKDVEIRSCWELLLSAQVISENSDNPKDDTNGLTHFHIACMADHTKAVEFFLKNGISVNETINTESPYSGYTPLHLAARYSALKVIKVLLNHGANTQLKDTKGMTFLCMLLETRVYIINRSSYSKRFSDSFVEDANSKSMIYLLENGNYTIDYAGLTHFHLACSLADLSIAARMLQNITDINQALDMDAPKWAGYTALHFAAYSSLDMVKMLVKNGANILAKDAKGDTPLDMCINVYRIKDLHAVLSLDENWRSILMSDRKTRLLDLIFAMKDENQLHNFLEPRLQIVNTFIPLDSPTWQGFTPLHIAVMFFESNDNETFDEEKYKKLGTVMMKLMAKAANVNAQDILGQSPIHLAFRMQLKCPKYLLLKFCEKIENAIDNDNLSHLHIACQMCNIEFVEKILQSTVDVNIPYKGKSEIGGISPGMTPLHCAATNDEIVRLLLLRDANPMLKDSNGLTAIHHSCGSSNAILSIPNLKDCIVEESGLSYLHIAVRCGNVAVVEKLLEEGANINQALLYDDFLRNLRSGLHNYEGDTPLDLALEDQSTMIELLLRRGADIRYSEFALPDIESLTLSNILKPIVSSLDLEDNLFKRLEREVGITSLHMACSKKDVNLIKALLASGADVNAQINMKSRLWPGFTALHIVMHDEDHEQNLDEIVKLLLDNGADVTLTTRDVQKTALYLAYDSLPGNYPSNRYSCMRMILRAHKDFTVNPIREDGISYFHVAASIGDIVSAKQFLDYGVNINQRTDFFNQNYTTATGFYRETKGFTALHLVTSSEHVFINPVTQLEMVDLLLNHGSDIHAEDGNGNTPLHLITEWNHNCEDIILRLVRSGVNVNYKNVLDQTFLELLIKSNNIIKIADLKFFLKIGCIFNVFDSVTEEGLIPKLLPFIHTKEIVFFIKSSMINFPHLMQTDDMGRNVIHNIVSRRNERLNATLQKPVVSEIQYAMLMTELEKLDCDVDHQDTSGKTALHYAVLFRNFRAISGLLMAGADVNVLDASRKTAFSYIFETCTAKCLEDKSFDERQSHNQYDHFDIFSIFVIHLKKLLTFGLDVNQINVNLLFETFEKFNDKDMAVPNDFQAQVNDMKSLKIAQSRFTLGNFLSETDAIVTYLTLPRIERNAIDKFFMYDVQDMFTKSNQVAGIFLLQYRKAVKRMDLNEPAKFALESLSNFSIPNLCSTKILNLLTNSELSNMIEVTA